MKFRFQPADRTRVAGFTLVEIMVAIVLIGVLAMLAIPALQRTQRASRNARMVNDFRVFTQAFEIYNTQQGGWPDTAAPAVVPTLPTSIADTLRSASWQANTALGGQRDLDAKLDDGNLASGRFQKTSPTRVIYVLASGS
jgi:prepilin-type N-terminal cleavage/methylation domain-containing protein